MKRIFPFILLAACLSAAAQAPEANSLHDEVIQELCSYVSALRSTPDDYESVRNRMAQDMKWTMMSEFADSCSTPDALCGLRERVKRTGINDIALQAEHMRGTVAKSAELFCNGNDPKYNYSLYEVKVKAGQTVRSHLSHRKGQQYFLIIPYSAGISAEITCNGETVRCIKLQDGSLSFVTGHPLKETDIIEIALSNTAADNRSAVIINHNSHRQ